MQLARLPAEALAAYRRRVDPLAERWYRDGVANRDEALLRRVVDELFCSSWGDDALLALGELALERGDYAAARRYWEQISPLTRDPNGKPLWLALRGVDLDKHWPEIERRWPIRPQPPTWLAYPDTDSTWPMCGPGLILVSIRAGEFDRAALELDAFRRWHPQAAGPLGRAGGTVRRRPGTAARVGQGMAAPAARPQLAHVRRRAIALAQRRRHRPARPTRPGRIPSR